MFKKLISVVIAFCIVLNGLNIAYGFYIDEKDIELERNIGFYTTDSFTVKDGIVTDFEDLTGDSFEGDVRGFKCIIPSEIDGQPIVGIGDYAFDNSGLREIILPDSIKTIGKGAFYACCDLDVIEIPDSVTSIGESAFHGCSELKEIKLPKNITSIEDKLFYGCSNLRKMTIHNNIKTIGKYAFYGCSNLIKVVIPESVTSIGSKAFGRCSGLLSVKISNSVETIAKGAFYKCSNLIDVVIPENVKTIEERAFYECKRLVNVIIPKNVTSIGNKAFYKCIKLKIVKMPDSVVSIGDYAFCGCNNLLSIKIPDSVTSIGESVFCGCKNLQNIKISDKVTSIGNSVFYGCENLKYIKIPKNVVSIGNEAFKKCSNLKRIVIPESVTSIEKSSFSDSGIEYICGKNSSYSQSYALENGIKFEAIGSHEHEYYDKYDSTNHWKVCSYGEKIDVEKHKFEWIMDKAPTENESGLKYEECIICGYRKDKSVSIININSSNISIDFVGEKSTNYRYSTPNITLKNGSNKLIKDVDYTVKYYENEDVGTAMIVIIGINNYTGVRTTTFDIVSKKVENIKQKSIYTNKIKLSWEKEIKDDYEFYEIYRSTSKNGEYKKIDKFYEWDCEYVDDKGLSSGKNYYYKIRRYNRVGSKYYYGPYSDVFKASTRCKAPTVTLSTPKSGSIKVSWKKVTGAAGYQVKMATSKAGTYNTVKTVTSGSTLSYTNTGRTKGKTYYYKVRAYKTVNGKKVYSDYSTIKSIKAK